MYEFFIVEDEVVELSIVEELSTVVLVTVEQSLTVELFMDELLVIDILNLYGSLAIGYVCFRAKVWQAASLEVAWFCVGTYSMIKNITLDDSSNSSNSSNSG